MLGVVFQPRHASMMPIDAQAMMVPTTIAASMNHLSKKRFIRFSLFKIRRAVAHETEGVVPTPFELAVERLSASYGDHREHK